ncbi:hypothetical protein C1H46_032905 [Malus baccata]|uniref:Uncharacterized protein n=1 Tax=Malus baccata TaxID=106549 RepID=A0A540L4Y8_MALBA|nr:hypothetical protein C1H46_032905 [Malus baccata]
MESLDSILLRDRLKSKWDGDRLNVKYRNITRFVLQELFGRDNDRGSLHPNCIFLTSGEAKVEPSYSPYLFRQEFILLIDDMLRTRNNPEKSELTHFIKMASKRKITFKQLFHHPLLQSTTERFRFPTRAVLKFKYNRKENWEQEYERFNKREVNFDSQIQKSIYKDAFKLLLNHEGTGYKNTVVDVLRFSKNAANHINQHLKKLSKNSMTEEEIENELTKVFPTRLIDLYEFLVNKDISMDFLGLKY